MADLLRSDDFNCNRSCDPNRWVFLPRRLLCDLIGPTEQETPTHYYSTSLFQQLGYDYEDRLMLGGLLSVTQLVGATVPIFIIDHFGRRPLLLIGSFMMMSCHAITGAAIGTSHHDWVSNQPSAKAGTAFMFVFMYIFEISWGPIAWGLPAEILPSTIRAKVWPWQRPPTG